LHTLNLPLMDHDLISAGLQGCFCVARLPQQHADEFSLPHSRFLAWHAGRCRTVSRMGCKPWVARRTVQGGACFLRAGGPIGSCHAEAPCRCLRSFDRARQSHHSGPKAWRPDWMEASRRDLAQSPRS